MNIIQKPCAVGNWHTGRNGHKPEAVVIHLMAGSLAGTDAWFNTTPAARGNGFASSAHYGIGKAGEVHQYVQEPDTAYHAGRVKDPTWKLLPQWNPNASTIGIEHEGRVTDPWSAEMVRASSELVTVICSKYSIPIDRDHIVGHHEIFAPKPCPGPLCPLDHIVELALKIQQP